MSLPAMLEPAYRIDEWSELFVAVAGAGAALAGLVFVAVSINIERILKLPGVPARALATVLLLLVAVIASIFGLAPGQSTTTLGIELLVTGLVAAGMIGRLVLQSERAAERTRTSRLANRAMTAAGTVPFALAGASLIAEAGGGLYWVLAGVVAALTGAVVNAWVLLVEILR